MLTINTEHQYTEQFENSLLYIPHGSLLSYGYNCFGEQGMCKMYTKNPKDGLQLEKFLL